MRDEQKSFAELEREADQRNKESEDHERSVVPTYGFRRHSKWEVHGGRLISVEQ